MEKSKSTLHRKIHSYKKEKSKNRIFLLLGGAAVGVINGLLGAGGGMIAVPVLSKLGSSRKEAHAGAVMMIFFLSLFSAAFYLFDGRLKLEAAYPYIPGGIIGAIIGAVLLSRLPDKVIRKTFAIFMLYTGIRLFMR